jgi:hypothetical protein
MPKLKELFESFLDNVFDYVTIIIAGYVVIRQQLQPASFTDITELATWILAVLGLLAVSGLWERHRRLSRIERITKEGRDLILRRMSGKVFAKDFFKENIISNKLFSSADIIYISGMTLVRTTREHKYVLEQRLIAGATIRVIIIETDNNLLKELTRRSSSGTNIKYWKDKLQVTQSTVGHIAKTPENRGKIELGYLPYIPSYGFVIVDPHEQNGYCVVEIYHHESAKSNPTFEVSRSGDPEWFQFFKEQFDTMWKSCRVVSLEDFNNQE